MERPVLGYVLSSLHDKEERNTARKMCATCGEEREPLLGQLLLDQAWRGRGGLVAFLVKVRSSWRVRVMCVVMAMCGRRC